MLYYNSMHFRRSSLLDGPSLSVFARRPIRARIQLARKKIGLISGSPSLVSGWLVGVAAHTPVLSPAPSFADWSVRLFFAGSAVGFLGSHLFLLGSIV